MRVRITLFILLFTGVVSSYAQEFKFEKETINYGKVAQGSEGIRVFEFTNIGDAPLIIKHIKSSCGCAVPQKPEKPIMPGESSTIEVRYATNRLGKINKNIKITTNEGANPHVIKVLGNVSPKEEEESLPSSSPSMLGGGGGN